jgi:hypothetical protein
VQAALSPPLDLAATTTPRGIISSLQGSMSLAASRASHSAGNDEAVAQSGVDGPLAQVRHKQLSLVGAGV